MTDRNQTVPFHTEDRTRALARTGSDPENGLAESEAASRLLAHGKNELQPKPSRSRLALFLQQFRDVLILVLLAAAVLAAFTGDFGDVAVILLIVLVNAAIGSTQEARAEDAVRALRSMLTQAALVRRGGSTRETAASEIVPGDLVVLEAGAVVPCDLRLLEANALHVQEATLTGESLPVHKQTEALPDADLPLGDRTNMAYKGTLVSSGRGIGLAVATGMSTELGRIASMLSEGEVPRTPLQMRLATFGRRLSVLVIAIAVLVFTVGAVRGEPWDQMLLLAISLAVAAIPEALPAVVTIALALGAKRMAARNAVVRRLPAVETLGSVTYLCTDKTGTLTQNSMQVRGLFLALAEHERLPPESTQMRLAMAISNDVVSDGDSLRGEATETALCTAAAASGLRRDAAIAEWPRRAEVPFTSESKSMTTVHESVAASRWVAFHKGAPEVVLPLCRLAEPERTAITRAAERFADAGRRVLAFAERSGEGSVPADATTQQDLQFLGLCALEDPLREEAKQAVQQCRRAGIVPLMVTGDHPATARAIALQADVIHEGARVVTGTELTTMDDAALAATLAGEVVFARVAPEHKIRIVHALQARGEVVALTGDGVNDAPALRAADIGVAMGKGGTDVAREAADMVLLDDNLATVVAAVEEGRRMYDSVRKFVRFLMTGNSAELMTILLAPVFGLPLPLLPIQILWINLVTDGLPGLALANEPSEPSSMQRPPRPSSESLFSDGAWQHMVVIGGLMAALALMALAIVHDDNEATWRTVVFTTLVTCQLLHVLTIRSERQSLWSLGFRSNWPLVAVVIGSLLLQLAVIYTPLGNRLLATAPLRLHELALAVGAGLIVMLAVEGEKALGRRGRGLFRSRQKAANVTSTTSRS